MSDIDDLAHEVTVLILGGGRGTRLAPLTPLRSKPAVPIAGKYRLIDIPISNAINSGMERMYVLTQFNSVSLHRHISRTYRFDSFSRGYVQILAAQQTPQKTLVPGYSRCRAAEHRDGPGATRRTRGDPCRRPHVPHGLPTAPARPRRKRRRHHDRRDALLRERDRGVRGGAGRRTGRILEFREKPGTAEARDGMEVSPDLLRRKGVRADQPYLASMGIYIFRKEALLEALANDLVDFGNDIIPAEVEGAGFRRISSRATGETSERSGRFSTPTWTWSRRTPHSLFTTRRGCSTPGRGSCQALAWTAAIRQRVAGRRITHGGVTGRQTRSSAFDQSIRGDDSTTSLIMGVDAHYPEALGRMPRRSGSARGP